MKENNNELNKNEAEQVAGGVDPLEVEKAAAEIAARQAALKGCAQAANALEKESKRFRDMARKMLEKEEAKRAKINKVLNFLTFGYGTKWLGE